VPLRTELLCAVKVNGAVCGRPSQVGAPPDPGETSPPCPGHYAHRRKGEPYRELRAARGTGTQLPPIRLTHDVRAAIQAAAEREGIEESEWVRRAISDRLDGYKKGRAKP
jgi:hypothetical protein